MAKMAAGPSEITCHGGSLGKGILEDPALHRHILPTATLQYYSWVEQEVNFKVSFPALCAVNFNPF